MHLKLQDKNTQHTNMYATAKMFCAFQGGIMKLCQHPSLLLWLAAVVAASALGSHAAGLGEPVGKVPFFPHFYFGLADSLTQLCLCVIVSVLF